MGSVGAVAGRRTSALYVVGIIFRSSRGNVGNHTCSEIIESKRYEGLFAKLNSGATNSVGGTSERSDDLW